MPFNLTTGVLKEITDFAKDSNVDRVVLFGSRARGTIRKEVILILRYRAMILILFLPGYKG